MNNNLDQRTVEGFGDEWTRFDQSGMSVTEAQIIFDNYFSIFPWDSLPDNASGFDMGCGSGRWARFIAPRVGRLHCIDPSSAIDIARSNLSAFDNVEFHSASVADNSLLKESQDFGYSLGVLHHVPDTAAAIRSCVELLRPGAPLLLYLYYAFDNRPVWFRSLWKISDFFRHIISRLPPKLKNIVTDFIALVMYLPIARCSALLDAFGVNVKHIPLYAYRHCSFYTMRTDSLDRFGTALERRFSRSEIESMMRSAGLVNIRFSDSSPYWCAVGTKS